MTVGKTLTALILFWAGTTVAAQNEPASPTGAPPSVAEIDSWFKFRQTKFAELKAAAVNQPAEIAALKARSAAALAAAGPLGGVDRPFVALAAVAAPTVVYDDPATPRMVVVPAGEFSMGSPPSEPGRAADEGPRHRVRVGYPLAVSMFPVVYGEYALFVADTHRPSARCAAATADPAATGGARDWRDPGYPVTIRHPVTCVDHADAEAYAAWASRKTGHRYRLLSEAEYEYVNRGGTSSPYWWGDTADTACAHANDGGRGASPVAAACHAGVAPVNGYKPNAFGLFDTAGNISSWTADCWRADYTRAPVHGSARRTGDCRERVVRGGSWASGSLRSASRDHQPAGLARADVGFRVAREL